MANHRRSLAVGLSGTTSVLLGVLATLLAPCVFPNDSAAVVVEALPYLLVKMQGSKCLSVDTRSDTTLRIEYYVPDLVIPEKRTEDKDEESKDQDVGQRSWHDRQREHDVQRRDLLNRRGEMTIMVMQREHSFSRWRRTERTANPTGTGTIRQTVDSRVGILMFVTGQTDGYVEICVQSYSMKSTGVQRVAFNVTKVDSEGDMDDGDVLYKYDQMPDSSTTAKSANLSAAVKQMTSEITREFIRMERRIYDIRRAADGARDRDSGFHVASVSLNRAVRYWPIFRMLILLFAGYFQVSVVVKFMKAKHIY